ncbi:unnamed protein product [Choristocarpus tenellus]
MTLEVQAIQPRGDSESPAQSPASDEFGIRSNDIDDSAMDKSSSTGRSGRGVRRKWGRRGTTLIKSLGAKIGAGQEQVGSEGLGLRRQRNETESRSLVVTHFEGATLKGPPTKSPENEDRFVHAKINLPIGVIHQCRIMEDSVCAWVFAVFDGHAGPNCAHYLKENFVEYLMKCKVMNPPPPSLMEEADFEQLSIETVLVRALRQTMASLTRVFERHANVAGEISGACAIAGMYCQGSLVLANVGDCQAVYHGHLKSSPGVSVTLASTIHDASNPSEVARFETAGGFVSSTGRFQGVLEPSRTVGDVDLKASAPKGCIASYPEVSIVDMASELKPGWPRPLVPPFLVVATDGIWNHVPPNTVVAEVKAGIKKIQAHKKRFDATGEEGSGCLSFTDSESGTDTDEESYTEGKWAPQLGLANRVVALAQGGRDDATAVVLVFE